VAPGLALAAKLTAVLSLAAVLAWGLLVAALAARSPANVEDVELATPPALGSHLARAWVAGRGWALALAAAVGVFVMSNPHLYPNPVRHTGHLFQTRAEIMRGQQGRVPPPNGVYDPLDRASYLLRGGLVDGTLTGSRGRPLEAALAPLGAATLLVANRRGWRPPGQIPAEGLVLVVALAYCIGIGAFLTVRWDRYLVPTLIIGTLFSGLGLSAMIRWLSAIALRLKGRADRRADRGPILRPGCLDAQLRKSTATGADAPPSR